MALRFGAVSTRSGSNSTPIALPAPFPELRTAVDRPRTQVIDHIIGGQRRKSEESIDFLERRRHERYERTYKSTPVKQSEKSGEKLVWLYRSKRRSSIERLEAPFNVLSHQIAFSFYIQHHPVILEIHDRRRHSSASVAGSL